MTSSGSREFIYEVLLPSEGASQSDNSTSRSGKMFIRVPYSRMTQEMKRINRLGGKIISITPVGQEVKQAPPSGGEAIQSTPPAEKTESPIEPPQSPNYGFPWWVEISTVRPRCTYYFGPFESETAALADKDGYIEDLQAEGAEGIEACIKQCQPDILTQEW